MLIGLTNQLALGIACIRVRMVFFLGAQKSSSAVAFRSVGMARILAKRANQCALLRRIACFRMRMRTLDSVAFLTVNMLLFRRDSANQPFSLS